MTIVHISKLELKKGLEKSTKLSAVESGNDIENLIASMLTEELTLMREKLRADPESKFSREDILKELRTNIENHRPEAGSSELSDKKIEEMFPHVLDYELYKWKVKDSPSIEVIDGSKQLTVGLEVDYLEHHDFRGQMIVDPNSFYGSFRLVPDGQKILVLVFSSPIHNGRMRKTIRSLLSQELKVMAVKWEDLGLRNVRNADSESVASVRATGLEGRITLDASATNLQKTNLYGQIEDAEFLSIRYNSKSCPGNQVKINGRYGTVITTMDEKATVKYIRGCLLRYSTY